MFRVFTFFMVLLLFNFTLSELIKGEDAERRFSREYIYRSNRPVPIADRICELEKKRKIEICNAVMTDENFNEEFKMYLNKLGTIIRSEHALDCEEHPLSLYYVLTHIEIRVTYKMLPCFGRHDPVRTRWDIDDYYNVLFLSQGDEDDAVFIFIRYLSPKRELYKVYGLLKGISVDNVPEVNLEKDEIVNELQSLHKWSRNNNTEEIEYLYIKYVLIESFQIPDTVCNASFRKKAELCSLMLLSFKLERSFFNILENVCLENRIQFAHFLEYNELIISQKMFPCYGFDAVRGKEVIYLGGGFRENSVLIFKQNNIETFNVTEFIENVELY